MQQQTETALEALEENIQNTLFLAFCPGHFDQRHFVQTPQLLVGMLCSP